MTHDEVVLGELATPRRRWPNELAQRLLRIREAGLVAVLAALVVGTALGRSSFVSSQNLRNIGQDTAILALLAIGQTAVLVSRNIDLSVGSVLGLTAFMSGKLLYSDPHVPIALVFVAGIASGCALGAANGALVTIGRIPALVATLGMLYVVRGIDYAWAGGQLINANNLPAGFLEIGNSSVIGIPSLVIVAAAVMLAAGYVMRSYRAGRELYAVGSNPGAAVLVGIKVSRRTVGAFVFSGALAGLCGVLWTSYYGTVDATAGNGLELQVVAAAVVGGVAIFGGSGSVYGAVLGALVLSVISSALVVLRINAFWEQAIDGTLLVLAIGIDRLLTQRLAGVLRTRGARRAG